MMFVKGFTVGPVQTNCYILGDEETKLAALIDPGDSGAALAAQVKKEGYELAMILLTHGHFDHIGGVRDAVNAAKAENPEKEIPVYIHSGDYPVAPASFARGITLKGVPGIHHYDEDNTVQLGNLTIKVMSTPGHTQGGVCLMVENALFTGDTLFAGSCGRTDFQTSSPTDMMASLKRLSLLPGDYAVYPGHESASTLEQERKTNPYMLYAVRQSPIF